MDKLGDRVPIPPKDTMNTGLSPAREATMLAKLGRPGQLTKNCSDPGQKFKKRIKFGVNVGPFKVSGLDFAVESLRQIFAEVEQQLPDVLMPSRMTECFVSVIAERVRSFSQTTVSAPPLICSSAQRLCRKACLSAIVEISYCFDSSIGTVGTGSGVLRRLRGQHAF